MRFLFALLLLTNITFAQYHAEATALFARFDQQPSTEVKVLMNALIDSLKTNNLWDNLDVFYVFAGHTEQGALLNWKADANNATAVNSPTWTAKAGFAGNGSTSYINLNYNPSTQGVEFTLNKASFGIKIENDVNSGQSNQNHGSQDAGGNRVGVRPRNDSQLSARYWLNSTERTERFVSSNSDAFWIVSRTASNVQNGYKDGYKTADTDASTVVPNLNLFVGACNFNGSPNYHVAQQISVVFAGAGLSDAQVADMNAAVNAYMTGIAGVSELVETATVQNTNNRWSDWSENGKWLGL